MTCANCGLPRHEHHHDGAAYGVCGEFKEREMNSNDWRQHPHTRRMNHAHNIVITQLRVAMARISYLERQVEIYKDHATKASRIEGATAAPQESLPSDSLQGS